ncbi:MAG: glycosyltransferase family 39 protein [Terriglobales bacterium]
MPVLLILLYVLQCAWFIRTQSFTVDESDHIIAGLDAWWFGEFERWHEHPPLARLLFALPLLGTDWKYENRATGSNGQPIHTGSRLDETLRTDPHRSQDGQGWYLDEEAVPLQPAPEVWLYRARSMNVLLGAALLVLLWFTERRLFSEGAATFMLALAAFSPDLIAHFSVATTDGAGTLFTFATVAQLIRWRHKPARGETLLLGIVLGAMLISKLNTLPVFLVTLLLVLMSQPPEAGFQSHPGNIKASWGLRWQPRLWNWGKAAAAGAVSCLVVWAGYFFHVSKVIFDNGLVTLHFAGYTKVLTYPFPVSKHIQIFIPACEYLTGLGMVFVHNLVGHRSFFLGHASPTGGWKLYFPVAVLLKWPLLVLLLALAGGLVLLLRRRFPQDLLLMSIFPLMFFLMAISGRINIGVRHVLPVYPFLLLYAGAAWEWTRGFRKRQALLATVLCLQAADCLRYAPDYLSYFNAFVNPSRSYEYLSDSNLDWGQGLVALRKYQAAHPSETLHLAYYGLVDPAWYGIRYSPLGEDERVTGTVVVSATHLSGQLLNNPDSYHWLLAYPRKTILNHSLYVFEIPASATAR